MLRGLWDGEEEARWVGEEIEALQRRGERCPRSPSWSAPASRPASSRNASSPWACPIASSAARASTSARRSATRWPISASSISPPTIWPSSASSTCRGAASAPRRLQALHRLARAERIALSEAAARLVGTDELKPAARRALGDFLIALSRWRGLAQNLPHPELAGVVLDEFGYTADVAGGQIARRAGPAREPEGAGCGDGGVRQPRRLPRPCQPGHGEHRRPEPARWSA